MFCFFLFFTLFSYSLSNWELDCGGGDVSLCADSTGTELFPVTSSVTFIDIPVNIGPPKTRCFLIYRRMKWSCFSGYFFFLLMCGALPSHPGFKSTSQSMTATGTMYVGLSWPFLLPGIIQVRIKSVPVGIVHQNVFSVYVEFSCVVFFILAIIFCQVYF